LWNFYACDKFILNYSTRRLGFRHVSWFLAKCSLFCFAAVGLWTIFYLGRENDFNPSLLYHQFCLKFICFIWLREIILITLRGYWFVASFISRSKGLLFMVKYYQKIYYYFCLKI
jgi:hypothetical protein